MPRIDFFSPRRWRALFFLAVLLAAVSAQAQLTVDLQLKRRLYMINEPVLATVTLGNQTGRDLVLADTQEGGPWFSFQIVATDGRIVPPRRADYELEPLSLHAGETVKRTVNLNELYAMGDYGSYRVKASIYVAPAGKYFGSKQLPMELSDGRKIWTQVVGVPGENEAATSNRKFALLTLESEGAKMLYVRIQGADDDTIYGCYNLGKMVDGVPPDAKFDSGNNLAVLQLIGPRTYLLSRIGVNGNFLGQGTYITPKSQPYLRKTASGALQIVGATREVVASNKPPDNAPKLSDRPPGF
jgi:hypothetical protein